MGTEEKYARHYEENTIVNSRAESVFDYVDDHTNISLHMNKSSWRMGGGSMNTHIDDKKFQEVGSHIQMDGTVFGMNLYLDEVVTKHEPPLHKEWQTVGDVHLLVIDHYKLGFKIEPDNSKSRLKAYIDYNLPKSIATCVLGYLFGDMYARWCVNQMINGTQNHFKST